MALDSTPTDLPGESAPDAGLIDQDRRGRRTRIVIAAVALALTLVASLGGSGLGAELQHSLAHAFPNLPSDGCGEPGP